MRTFATLLSLAVALSLSTAQAHTCDTWTASTTSDEMLVVEMPSGADSWVQWIVTDLCQDGTGADEDDPHTDYFDERGTCLYSIWIYYEANGIPGLQRNDSVIDDTCHGMIDGDMFVW